MRLVILAWFSAALAWTQTASTQILGLVTDSTGAIIPGATVTAKRLATGDLRTTTTNETGNYIFPLVESGEYEVSCVAAGFKTEVRKNIQLELNQKARIDFQLQVGQQAERIEVSSSPPLLKTEDATLGSVVDSRKMLELPLNGRNFAQAATLMPGVVFGTARMGIDGNQTIGTRAMPGQIVGISANGQRDANQNITLDGVSATDGFKSSMLFVPSLEAVEEFKIQSAVYSAEYGMNSGAQANVSIKSGTNQWHGTAFEFVRNDTFDARGFFLPPGQRKNKLRRNQFGGVFSGPIRRDRTFFLVNYEGRRERRGTPARATVPTVAMRNGDLSEILQPGNRWYPRDPNPGATRAIRPVGSNTPFPGNLIPRSLLNPVSLNILTAKKGSPFPEGGFMPLPNFDEQARAAGSVLNLTGTNDQHLDSDQYLGRVDHRFNDNHRLFGRYVIVPSRWLNSPLLRVNQFTTKFRAQNLGVGHAWVISPRMLNDLRVGYNRIRANQVSLHTNTDFSHRDLGLDMRVTGDGNRRLTPREEGLPNINITAFSTIGSGNVTFNTNETAEVADSVSISRGRHNFKFGGQWRHSPVVNEASNLPRGQITFSPDIVGIPDAFAAFLLGVPLNANSAEGVPTNDMHQQKVGLYWLDDWKATPKLTINYGVRWDWYGAVTDANGRIRNLSFAGRDVRTIGGVTYPMLVPDPLVGGALYDINWKQIMPRLGIVYRLGERMVIRMGSGLFYSPQQTNNFNILGLNPPFSGSTVFQNDRNNPIATIQNPFAGLPVGAGPAAIVMLGWTKAERDNRSMYLNNKIWQWTTEIERSFGQSFVTGIAYVGSAGSHLDMPVMNWNNPDPGVGPVQARRPVPFYVDSREPSVLLPLGTVRRLESWTNSNYHSLQARAEKRYSQGLTFNAAFNFQKAMYIGYGVNEGGPFGTNFTQDPRNRRGDYGRSQIDQRFRFVFSHIWEIPWMRKAKGPKGWILGGWAINGIVQFTSGLPVTISQNGDSHNTGPASFQRPHVVPGRPVPRVWQNRSIDRWFDTLAFVRSKCEGCPGEGVYLGPKGYGNAGTSLFDAPAQKTWDFACFKEFRPKEGHRIQFRYEAFNFLNTPQFGAPSRVLGAADFGRINSTVVNNREMQLALKYLF
ncbi:MAG: TonB-dependent receptor [Bryobacteraceae bacterium]|nr:TonB-dependent receptor [Bryobacteraceae bacterium]MDW8378229.1 carboxypeptidase regulatory-like domain-containing protein [Bryobacterales bacterium]